MDLDWEEIEMTNNVKDKTKKQNDKKVKKSAIK